MAEIAMDTLELLRQRRDEILEIARSHGVERIRVFGSVVRSEDSPTSDIDLLVDIGSETSSWFPAGLILDLQSMLGRRIDVVTERGLSPWLRERVLREAIPL